MRKSESGFASLGPRLLARKGGARPAMRSQLQSLDVEEAASEEQMNDLGWNDMGGPLDQAEDYSDSEMDGAGDSNSVVHQQQAEIARQFGPEGKAERGQKSQKSQESNSDSSGGDSISASAASAKRTVPVKSVKAVRPKKVATLTSSLSARSTTRRATAPLDPVENENPEQAGTDQQDDQPQDQAPNAEQNSAQQRKQGLDQGSHQGSHQGSTLGSDRRNEETKQKPYSGKKVAFTLRLDSDRHLKLRLASTLHGLSAQKLMTEALDKLLAETPQLEALAANLRQD